MQFILKVFILVLKMLYSIIKKTTPIQNKITFISRQGDTPSNDILLLAEALKAIQPETKTVFLCKMLKSNLVGMLAYGPHMLRQLYHLASSKVVVLDSYCIAASILKHKPSLIIFQMWHSMGSMKKFGYTSLGTLEGSSEEVARLMKMHSNYDWVFASAPAYASDLAAGFGTDTNKIAIMPLPRLDLLTDEAHQKSTRDKIFAYYPELATKKNILYCPTFRKNTANTDMYLTRLIDSVDQTKYNLIVKLHPIAKVSIQEKNIVSPDDFSTFDLLSVADYVISDYSCVVFEAAVLNIPLYFYAYDLSEYIANRGLAIDYFNECPGIITSNPQEIINDIDSGLYNWTKLKEFREKYIKDTNQAAMDMAEFILVQIKNKETAS